MKSQLRSPSIIYGYLIGIVCLLLKISLNFLICYIHIKHGYEEEKTVEITCIGMSVGFGISSLQNVMILIIKRQDIFKKLVIPLWIAQYLLSALASISFIAFANMDQTVFQWTKSVLPVCLLSLEFAFYKTFVEPKYSKEKPYYATNIGMAVPRLDDKGEIDNICNLS